MKAVDSGSRGVLPARIFESRPVHFFYTVNLYKWQKSFLMMLQGKRGAISLSFSMIIVILISLFILSFGITLLYDLVQSAKEVKELIEPQLPAQEVAPDKLVELPPVKESAAETAPKTAPKNCLEDYSCERYFFFVPIGWKDEDVFKEKSRERMEFFADISNFKFKNVGIVYVPLSFAGKCNLGKINPTLAMDQFKIKNCADRYADLLGLSYEKAIGLTETFESGRAFFNSKSVYSSLGHVVRGVKEETPSLVAHELGHAYSLCDEYSYSIYFAQDRQLHSGLCRNEFPENCGKKTDTCKGNTPTYRDYSGESVLNVCLGPTHYSVMGAASGSECGYDQEGYLAVGGFG